MLLTETLARCPVCGNDGLRTLLVSADYETQTGEYGIDECSGCGLAFTNPRPLEQELPKLYAQRSTADFPRAGGLVQRLREFAIDRYLDGQIGRSGATDAGPLAVLDYGCGDGALALGLLRWGGRNATKLHVTAVDFHPSAPPALASADAALSYRANAGWNDDGARYSMVFLRHVLEHHPEPLRLLGELAQALRPGGRLFVEVPNRRSVWARVFGRYYSGYYLPRHLLHFDRPAMIATLRRAGFRAVGVRLGHTPLIGHSLGYLTGTSIGNTGAIGLATYPAQLLLDILFRTSTTLRAVASEHA